MSKTPRPRRCTSFPFDILPADLQLLVMSHVGLHTLKSMTKSIPSVRRLYIEYPSSVIQDATSTMGHQISNLLLTTESLVTTIRAGHTDSKPDLEDMDSFLSHSLDRGTLWKIFPKRNDALGALQTMCEIDAEVVGFVQDYAMDIYERACHRDKPDAIPAPLVLSSVEKHRLTRAFYRLKLFGVLFYNYANRFQLDLEASYAAYFNRLAAFEIDELINAYIFLEQEGRHFKPAWPHSGCSFAKGGPWINNDPFNCWRCGGKLDNMIKVVRDRFFLPRRAVQPFWEAIHGSFLSYGGPWASPDRCRALPIKQWYDFPEVNEPSAGWALWHENYESSDEPLRPKYVHTFQTLGFCYWDGARLEAWGNMFSQEWLRADAESCHQVG